MFITTGILGTKISFVSSHNLQFFVMTLQINGLVKKHNCVPDLSFTFRTKSRKEKNKLASRACRLKKKAQHEANKLKLHGLEEEHSE